MEETGPIPLTEAFTRLYEFLDAHAQKAIEKVGKVSCKKGCAHCCYLLTSLTPTEGLNIAERLLGNKELRPHLGELLAELRQNAVMSSFKGVTRRSYFEKRLKCPFLTAKNECSIYSFRPSMCRYHIVISPAELCSPDAPKDVQTAAIDLTMLEAEVWRMDKEFFKSPIPIIAPISITVLWMMKKVIDDSDMSSEEGRKVKDLVDAAVDGIIDPLQWTLENAQRLIDDEHPNKVSMEQALADEARRERG